MGLSVTVVVPHLQYTQYDLITLTVIFYRCWGALTFYGQTETQRLCIALTWPHHTLLHVACSLAALLLPLLLPLLRPPTFDLPATAILNM